MERILIFIKHHFVFLWKIIEWGNGLIFFLFYKSRLEKVLLGVFNESAIPPFSYRRLFLSDAGLLHGLIQVQEVSDLEYFRPHGFDLISVRRQFKNRSFLIMGAFDGGKMVGYFFLRFFANRKCFVGRLIDKDYRGKGIGSVMNSIMYETAWRMGFRCLSTISQNNTAVMRTHAKNPTMIVIKELQNDYLLVEFIREAQSGELRASSEKTSIK
jgi:GNAT superfamily N-acetyltransferase